MASIEPLDRTSIWSIELEIERLQEAIKERTWKLEPRWLRSAAITHVVIHLNDVLQKLSKAGHRIDFNDEVEQGDVTDLIATFRNAACHIGSNHRKASERVTVSFDIYIGCTPAPRTPGEPNPYADDVMYLYGRTGLFHFRHLVRAVGEASQVIGALKASMT